MDLAARLNEIAVRLAKDATYRHRAAEDLLALAAAPSMLPQSAGTEREAFQTRMDAWLLACFGETIARDKAERNHRFLEESLELVQALGCTASEAHQLVDYVFGRPAGDARQEVGGAVTTLAALCLANGIDMDAAAEAELARIWTKVDVIRAKQAAKPKHSPLPSAQVAPPEPLDCFRFGDKCPTVAACLRESKCRAAAAQAVPTHAPIQADSQGAPASPSGSTLQQPAAASAAIPGAAFDRESLVQQATDMCLWRPRVFVDMDGVLVDFDGYATAHGLTGDDVKKRPGAYLAMRPIPGALEAVRSVIGMGFEVWVATKPPTGIPFAYADKAAWVLEHLPELKRRIIITHDKGLLGRTGDFLVDDRPHKANCSSFAGKLIPFTDGTTWADVLAVLRGSAPSQHSRAPASAKDRYPEGGDPQGLRGEAIEPAREATRPEAHASLLTDLRDLHGMALDAAQQVQGREDGPAPDPKHVMSEDEIVADLLATAFVDGGKEEFAAMERGKLIRLHHGFGAGIRNTYGLWHENRWGDASAEEPDSVSMRIIERLWDRVRAEAGAP